MSAFRGKADITFDRAEWSFDSDPRTSGVGDIPNCLSVPCYSAIQVAGQGMGHRQSLLEYDLVLLLLRLFAVVCRHHDNLSVLIYFNSRNRESGLLRCSNSATQIRLFEHHHECKATVAKKQARACLFTVIGGSAMKKIIAGPARNNSVETALAGHALPTSAGNCPTAGG